MAKALSLNEIRTRSARLARDWRDEPGDERQQGHQFVEDLLEAYGITKRKAALYERRAKRSSTGHQGYIDALLPGLCLIEMKSTGRDLEAAEGQALDYIDDLGDAETPRWVVTSDFRNLRVLDLEAEDHSAVQTLTLEELPQKAEALAFLAGYQTRAFGDKQQEQASVKAARIMGKLYEALGESGYDDHEASVFLVRVLFCLYADDSGMWERDLFYEFLERRTAEDGSDLGPQLAMLFQAMQKPPEKRQKNLDELIARFPYVNGGIFAEPASIPAFDTAMRALLLDACAFNWSAISPAVFGSLFQSVKSAKARRELGEHYTTETNILKTIEPLFLDELREEYRAAYHDTKKLKQLRKHLASLRVLDPACGCGNFLVVSYRELRKLDLEVLLRLQQLGDTTELPTLFFTRDDLTVSLDHFAGIEIEEWPARIATTALHLIDHQANQAMELALGMAPDSLPLDRIDTIRVANALRTDWSTIVPPSRSVMVVGNPPFVGQYTKQADQTEDLRLVWGNQYDGYLDYVTGWYKKAADYFAATRGGRFAFVSTNSVAQGQPVAALFRPLLDRGWRIRFAHQTFAWSSEAPDMAHVHCVIIGFDQRETVSPRLYTYERGSGAPVALPARNINPYLLDAATFYVTTEQTPLASGLPDVLYGSKPADGGNLLVARSAYASVAADAIAVKYLRPFVNAKELIHDSDRWCLWLEDADPRDIQRSAILRDRVEACRAFRLSSRKAETRAIASTPHLFAERRQPKTPYICIPRHFSQNRAYVTVARFEPDVIAGDANFTAVDADGLLFAVISSSMFMAWQRAVGGRIKSDLRFSNKVVWNNFPLPELDDQTRSAVILAGEGVLAARALHPDRSLEDHYNPLAMDPTLLKAHAALDRVVDRAFGAPRGISTETERQTVLFARYSEMTS